MDAKGFPALRTFKATLLAHYGIILLSLVRPVVLDACSQTETLLENATLKSPNYPSTYRSYSDCSWNITVPEGFVAVLRFNAFNVESCSNCGCDSVSFYDGPDHDSPLLKKACGSNVPSAIYANQNRMFVKFKSDGSVTYSGFSAIVSKGEVINQFIESENGTIQSPNYPNNYEADSKYIWNITVPENYQIFLEFLTFELQDSGGCSKDSVEVRDGQELSSPLLGKMCGTNVEKYMRSSTNKMLISFQSDSSQETKGFYAEFRKAEICGATIEATSGNFNTPNYPSNYRPVEKCRWNIRAPEDHHVLIRFLTFNIVSSSSCSKDFVRIYNGNDTNFAVLGKFCGTDTPAVTKSSSNEVTIEFYSDASEEAQGFSARFETDLCGEVHNSDSGTFHSPNYPNPYGSHEMCSWKVTVSEGYRVALRFDSFQMESSYRCGADAVTVYDGINTTSTEIKKLCGVTSTKTKVYSTGNTLSVRFVTDASYSKSGFSASYIKVPIVANDTTGTPTAPCQQNITSETGTVNSPRYPEYYSPFINCVWNIEVPEGKLVRLEFHSFDVEDDPRCSFDFVDIQDFSLGLSMGKYCGANIPQSLWSSGNKISLNFVTDDSFENAGFSATFSEVDYQEKILTADKGTLETPNYPNNYGPAVRRVWKISVPSSNKIFLLFLSFNLEYSTNCTDDFVDIYDGESDESPHLGRFCGTSPPGDIRSSSNKLTVIFATDTSEEQSGFSAKYEKEVICGSDSCRNGGTCKRTNAGVNRVYSCLCKTGYQGPLCEEKILCSSHTCENGGLCFQNGTGGTFLCVCNHGYMGEMCHERILCGNATCENGGFCTHDGKNGIFLCVCKPGFEGLFCEKAAESASARAVPIVIPVIILLVIASAVILYLLVRKRLRQQVTQPYDDMKKSETFFDKDEMSES